MKIDFSVIRSMKLNDLPEVVAIEKDCFGNFAWSKRLFCQVLGDPRADGIVMTVNANQFVVGFAAYRRIPSKQGSLGGIRVINLGVCLNYRLQGVGSQLIKHLVTEVAVLRMGRVEVCVRESNLIAQLFFRSLGFEAVSVVRKPFEQCDEDAYLMRYCLGQPMADPRSLIC